MVELIMRVLNLGGVNFRVQMAKKRPMEEEIEDLGLYKPSSKVRRMQQDSAEGMEVDDDGDDAKGKSLTCKLKSNGSEVFFLLCWFCCTANVGTGLGLILQRCMIRATD